MNQLHILLVPLVHTALTRWGTILGLDQSALDQLPDDEHSPDFMDDFLMFIDTHEWESFISNQVRVVLEITRTITINNNKQQ